jgi:ferredoxin-type protein NapG
MGVAVLADTDNCLNFLGLRCDVCYRVCPLIDQAITLDKINNPRSDRHAMFLPVVHADKCTGCGKCEKSCVLEKAAIKVLPFELARGELGHHYRKGWESGSGANRPRFGQPRQNLPTQPVPGDLSPLRSGRDPYLPAAPGSGSAR